VTIFAVCWLPYQGFFIFVYHHRHFAESSYVQHVYLSFYWLAMSNSMVNPIIYYWMNNRYYYLLYIYRLLKKYLHKEKQSFFLKKKHFYVTMLFILQYHFLNIFLQDLFFRQYIICKILVLFL